MDVSAILVSWNTHDILRDCLESVYRQTKEIDYEVIVIDNASTDGSIEMVRSEYPQTIIIENRQNSGFAVASNQGIRIAKGRYVLLLNSDTVVLDGAIQKTVAFADRYPDAAVVGCRVLNPDRTLQHTCFMYPGLLNLFLSVTYLYKIFPKSRLFGREQMTWWDRNDQRTVEVVTGCYMLVRREAIQQVGLMDENFFMYGEETDWCYRFAKAGWQCLFTPAAEIFHLGGASTAKVHSEMIIQLRISILLFIKKHRNVLVFNLSKLLLALFFLVRIPGWTIVKLVSKHRSEEAKKMTKTYWRGAIRILSQ